MLLGELHWSRWATVIGLLAALSWPAGPFAAFAEAGPEAASPSPFRGWRTLRVIEASGPAAALRAARLQPGGRDSLVMVNPRQSRLDIYHWQPVERREARPTDPEQPNALPLAEEFTHERAPLGQSPRDVRAADFGDDSSQRLVVLLDQPTQVEVHRWSEAGLRREMEVDLPPGASPVGPSPLRIVEERGEPTALVATTRGLVRVTFDGGGAAEWLEPKDETAWRSWWLADLDGDGANDLFAWRLGAGDEALVWRRRVGDRYLPPSPLKLETSFDDVAVLPSDDSGDGADGDGARIVGLRSGDAAMMQIFRLGRGEASPVGGQSMLPRPGGRPTPWAGLELDGRPVAVSVDPEQPQVIADVLEPTGWRRLAAYPIVTGVEQILAAPGEPGRLLLRARDAATLHASVWRDGRMSYPRPLAAPAPLAAKPEALLSLDAVGSHVWWVQRLEDGSLALTVWRDDRAQVTPFKGDHQKVDKVAWLGEGRLLVRDRFARESRLLEATRGEDGAWSVASSSPAHLRATPMDQFQLVPWDDRLRPARLVDGVLQWLDASLMPEDQVMLPDGRRIASLIPAPGAGGGGAWVLEQGGEWLHKMEPDAGGVLRRTETFSVPSASTLVNDPVLGPVLAAEDRLIRLTEGRPRALELVRAVDQDALRLRWGATAQSLHRVETLDVTGDGSLDLLVFDDVKHDVGLLRVTPEGEIQRQLVWQVFEDATYPYGGARAEGIPVSEPSVVAAMDLDGDGTQDLVMRSHDRLVIYLGGEDDLDAGPDGGAVSRASESGPVEAPESRGAEVGVREAMRSEGRQTQWLER